MTSSLPVVRPRHLDDRDATITDATFCYFIYLFLFTNDKGQLALLTCHTVQKACRDLQNRPFVYLKA